jgi:hypothetical protein
VAKALNRFETYTRFRDFKAFHIEQAKGFKAHLSEQRSLRSNDRLSKATLYATLSALGGSSAGWPAGSFQSAMKSGSSSSTGFSICDKISSGGSTIRCSRQQKSRSGTVSISRRRASTESIGAAQAHPRDFQGRLRGCRSALFQPAQLSENFGASRRATLQVPRGVQGLVTEPRPRERAHNVFKLRGRRSPSASRDHSLARKPATPSWVADPTEKRSIALENHAAFFSRALLRPAPPAFAPTAPC